MKKIKNFIAVATLSILVSCAGPNRPAFGNNTVTDYIPAFFILLSLVGFGFAYSFYKKGALLGNINDQGASLTDKAKIIAGLSALSLAFGLVTYFG